MTQRYIGTAADGRIPVEGGWATGVIELANPAEPERGGRDPEAPQRIATLMVSGRLRTGHTWSLADPDAPVWVDEAADVYPGGAAVADLRCPRCVTKLDIGRLGPDTLAVVEHQRGCKWLRRFLARRSS